LELDEHRVERVIIKAVVLPLGEVEKVIKQSLIKHAYTPSYEEAPNASPVGATSAARSRNT